MVGVTFIKIYIVLMFIGFMIAKYIHDTRSVIYFGILMIFGMCFLIYEKVDK